MTTQDIHTKITPISVLNGKRAAAIVFSYFPSDPRPMREACALARAGMKVDLFCLAREGQPAHATLLGVNVTRFRLDKRRGSKFHYLYQYGRFLLASFFWLSRRSGHDLVHVHNMPDFLVFAALLPKLRGARVVLDLHDPTPEVFMTKYGPEHRLVQVLRLIEHLSIQFSDLVLTPNRAFEQLFRSRNPNRRIAVIMNSPLESIFPLRPPTIRDEQINQPFTVMYHGTLVERHGLHLALEAVAQLRKTLPNLRFQLYGASTEYLTETIFPLIKRLNLGEQVHYLGEQPLEQIALRIGECDLGLIPNLKTPFTEINFPTRIFEYLACGKPVIVPDTKGIRDYFTSEDILFFEPGNVTSLAAQILRVAFNFFERAAIVRNGQRVYARYLWSTQEQEFLREVAALVSGKIKILSPV